MLWHVYKRLLITFSFSMRIILNEQVSLHKQTKNEVGRRGLDGKEMQKTHFKVYSLEEKLLISFSWLPMNMMKTGGACMSTSAKSATTVDSRTWVGVKSWTCRKFLAMVTPENQFNCTELYTHTHARTHTHAHIMSLASKQVWLFVHDFTDKKIMILRCGKWNNWQTTGH